MPKHPLGVRGERKVPSCTMHATENGGEGEKQEDIPVPVILVSWMIERRNESSVNWEEI